MVKKRIFKIITLTLALVMLFSTTVFAAEHETGLPEVELEEAYEVPEYSFMETYEFRDTLWGEIHVMKVNVQFTIAYSYADGSWSEINYVDIDVKSVTIDGNSVNDISSVEYKVYTSSAYRKIKINNSVQIRIDISIDEYGELETYAYII